MRIATFKAKVIEKLLLSELCISQMNSYKFKATTRKRVMVDWWGEKYFRDGTTNMRNMVEKSFLRGGGGRGIYEAF